MSAKTIGTGELISCGCCGDDVPLNDARFDEALIAHVCPDCMTQLRWAQAHLKQQGIIGIQRPDAEARPLVK